MNEQELRIYKQIKTKHPNSILVLRVGSMYYSHGEDALRLKKIIGKDSFEKSDLGKSIKKIQNSNQSISVADEIPLIKRIRIAEVEAEARLRMLKLNENLSGAESMSFNKDILKYKAGLLPKNYVFNVGKPNTLLTKNGIPDKEISLTHTVLEKGLIKHDLLIDDFINFPEKINNPDAIFNSKKFPTSKIVVTKMLDVKKRAVMVVVRTDKNNLINDIASVYGRVVRQFQNWEKQGLLLYKEKNFKI